MISGLCALRSIITHQRCFVRLVRDESGFAPTLEENTSR